MKIELKGVVQYYDNGHKCVDVVVVEDEPYNYKRHRVGVDVKVNPGKIRRFLAAMYDVPPGDIVWPPHIKAKDSDVGTSLAL